MSKHAPAPWSHDGGAVFDAGDWFVAHVDRHQSGPETTHANARLIAAAPEMYEALRRLLAAHAPICEGDGDMGTDEDCDFARAALAKVEG